MSWTCPQRTAQTPWNAPGGHADSPYFAHPDVYNMESTDTLTVLHNFKTMQQTSEWSCGVTAALMVLDWYGKLGDWNEESLAALRHSLDGTELEGYIIIRCKRNGKKSLRWPNNVNLLSSGIPADILKTGFRRNDSSLFSLQRQ